MNKNLDDLMKALSELESILKDKVNNKKEKNKDYLKLCIQLKKHLIMTAKIFLIDNDDAIENGNDQLTIVMSASVSALFEALLAITEQDEEEHKKAHEFIEHMKKAIENAPHIKNVVASKMSAC